MRPWRPSTRQPRAPEGGVGRRVAPGGVPRPYGAGAGRFDLDAVADGICKKLIFRHPHVFGEVSVSGTGEVLSNWEELKRKEKGQATNTDALEAVARSLPALWRAEKVQKKAKKAGFDWPDVSGALDKLSEELEELKTAVAEAPMWRRSWAICSSPPSTSPVS